MEQQSYTETRKNGHTPATNQPAADGALSLLWDGLPPAVVEKLAQTLDPALVSHRKGRGGKSFPYLEGHAAISQANRVFGYGGWGYELMGDVAYRDQKSVDTKTGEISTSGMYCATVRVTVPGVPPRTDVGCHAVAEETSEGHDTAYKGAVTDALKRALRSFGDQFGNGLYGDIQEDTMVPSLRESILHLGRAQGLSDAKLKDAVKKRTGKDMEALSAPELAGLLKAMARKHATSADSGQAPSKGEGSTSAPSKPQAQGQPSTNRQ